MAHAIARHVALVSESRHIGHGDLAMVSAALQKQATRDLARYWKLTATVDAFARLEDVPIGYWPIVIMDNIHVGGAAGVHEDENGQPFALVTADADRDVWSLTCSHELLEMLVDPFGNRLVAADSPKPDQGRVQMLVEVCDPSESAQYAYTVNGILVSDFYTPHFFDPLAASGVRYSFTGAIEEPRQVLPGGYLSWVEPGTGVWWQETWFAGDQPVFRDLGKLDGRNGSFRSQIDRITGADTARAHAGGMSMAKAAGIPVRQTVSASETRAARLRQQIQALEGKDTHDDDRFADARASNGSKRRGTSVTGLRRAPSILTEVC
jgi:hypothetical protein